jgi:tRNA(fMet)-specific endonuclease VapC
MGIVLDSSILIAAEKQRFVITEFFSSHADEKFYLAAVSAAELLHGVERAIPTRKGARAAVVEHFLEALEVIDYDLAVARTHATLWAALAKAGLIIGPYDLLIAATALTHGHKLATLNESEFKHVPKLKLVDVNAYVKATGQTEQ